MSPAARPLARARWLLLIVLCLALIAGGRPPAAQPTLDSPTLRPNGPNISPFQIVLPVEKSLYATSGFTVTNQAPSAAMVMMEYFSGGYPGGSMVHSSPATIQSGGSLFTYLGSIGQLPPGFVGEVAITSDQPITGSVVVLPVHPQIWMVEPSVLAAGQGRPITIAGGPFTTTSTVDLGAGLDLTVTSANENTIVSEVPGTLAAGYYTLTVRNPNGGVRSAPDALRVDALGPVAHSLEINGGALATPGVTVTLAYSGSDPTDEWGLMVSFSPDAAAWGDWEFPMGFRQWELAAGSGLRSVYARFRDPAGHISNVVSGTVALDPSVGAEFGLSINEAALYTNQVSVTLGIGAQLHTAQMQVSNDGGFTGAVWQPYQTRLAWQITQYGEYVLPRTVYVRFKDVNGVVSAPASDDIILDVNPPTGTVRIEPLPGLRAGDVRLVLSATDDVSGVGAMQISNAADFAGAAWEPYATSRTWSPAGSGPVYARFRDNAGNVSAAYAGAASVPIIRFFIPSVMRR